MRLDPALAHQDRVGTLMQIPSSHFHGILCHVFFSLGSAEALPPLRTLQIRVTQSTGNVEGSVTLVPVFITTSPVEFFSLKKLFYHQEENDEFKQRQYNAILLLQTRRWLSMYLGVCVETLFVGMLNNGRQRMAHLRGMNNPSSSFSLGSSVLKFWMQRGKERSWEGKKSNRV